jgi:hypothetical protein
MFRTCSSTEQLWISLWLSESPLLKLSKLGE